MIPKRLLMVFAVFLLFALMPACCCAEDNLLENGDFLELDEDHLPSGWYTDAYIREPGYTVFSVLEGDDGHPAAVSIHNIGSNDARFAQRVAVKPESLYCLSGYIRADQVEGGLGANLSIEGVYAFSQSCYETEGEWVYIEYYGETGPGQNDITVFARLGGYSGESTGTASFAELSLREVSMVPGDGVADFWFKVQAADEGGDEEEESGTAAPAWPWLLAAGLLYSLAFSVMIWYFRSCKVRLSKKLSAGSGYAVASSLLLSFVLRLCISCFVEGYMVDVNCFLSWGRTMAENGPAGFYQATSFCDYPPLYTYILGVNSALTGILGKDEATARLVFRFFPSLCDTLACMLLYRLIRKHELLNPLYSLWFTVFVAFNPATILNSSAWGQMDSVLCLCLLTVCVFAAEGKWMISLPVYVLSVLIKPQALMLGPLGLVYIIITLVREPKKRMSILAGSLISLFVLAAGVIPFSLQRNGDWSWLFKLYSDTLSSYPYATVNTANFYYLMGGNWSGILNTAHPAAPSLLAFLCFGFGAYWFFRAEKLRYHFIETVVSAGFALGFICCAVMQVSWAWVGGIAMVFAIVLVLGKTVRSGSICMLAYLGALLFILLYVFGVKMHERYIFPAILLLAAAWLQLRDRRILYLLILFSFTLFLNEGIVLDNSIRLGSSMGHLNKDTVWLADVIGLLNIAGAVYAVFLGTELLIQNHDPFPPAQKAEPRTPCEWNTNRKLGWKLKDTIFLSAVTAVYAAVTLLTLGSTRAPQTAWTSSSEKESVIIDLGSACTDFEMLYFAQVSRYDFSVAVSTDGKTWQEDVWAQMDQGQCWKWKYVTESYDSDNGKKTYYNDLNHIVRFSGRYVRLTSHQLGLTLNEILFRDSTGQILPAEIIGQTGAEKDSELFSDPHALLDEQDTLEKTPSLYGTDPDQELPAQPSWWNSTYFDEIYHARTAYEFLKGTVPYETSHPPLGKICMSLCVAVFGMTPFGWRFAGALAGILMLPGIYLLARQLTKKTGIAVAACLLMALDCMHLTQTQIATIDSFPVLFIIFAYFFMLRFLQSDLLRDKIQGILVNLGLSGLFMGLSIASKWIGIYAGAGLAVLFFWHCIRTIRLQHDAVLLEGSGTLSPEQEEKIHSLTPQGSGEFAMNRVVILCMWCLLFFILVPLAIYLASYIPYFAYKADRIHSLTDYLEQVWNAQVGMLNYHSTPRLGMDHPFYSPWWEWPIIHRPMYYAAEQYIPNDYSVHFSIFSFGNPVIWYGGLGALAMCIFRSLYHRRYLTVRNDRVWHLKTQAYDPRYAFIFVGILAQYLPWVLVPRGTYIYHYFASLPFLMLAVVLCFDGFRPGKRIIVTVLSAILIVLALAAFILLFPYASGISVPAEWLELGKGLLRVYY